MAQFMWDKNKKKAIPIEERKKQSTDSSQSAFSDMTDEQLAEYAESKGIDISRFNTRKKVISELEKAEGTD